MEQFDAFCEAVCRQVRHATPKERRAIRAELTGHLEDRAEVLLSRGLEEAQAESAAVAAMGDPEAIGRELNRQYPLGWLLLSRGALALAALLLLQLLAPALLTFTSVHNNIAARCWPERVMTASDSQTGFGRQALDLGREGDGWRLRVYESSLRREPGGAWEAVVGTAIYSQNPFAPLPGHPPGLVHLTEKNQGSSRTSSGSAAIGLYRAEVSRGQPSVTMEIPLSGHETTTLEIPLNWEEQP